MSRLQKVAIALAMSIGALDGFDVLAISYAAPGIARDWSVAPAALGIVISSGLVGMGAGSFLLAPIADRVGRRPTMLLCLALMTAGMFLAATASSIEWLCAWRVLAGLGIGGMVPTINTVAAEFSNDRRRDFCVSLMTIGYPIGGLVGGLSAAELIEAHGWRAVFVAGGVVTAVFLPLVWRWMPESPEMLEGRGDPAGRATAHRLLVSMGHVGTFQPSEGPAKAAPAPQAALWVQPYRQRLLLLLAAYFLHIMTFYFFSGWLPKMMGDAGFTMAESLRASGVMSLGGVAGGIAIGWAAPHLGLRALVLIAMVGTSLTMALFGLTHTAYAIQMTICLAIGVCVFGGMVGLSSLIARAFPAQLRATGAGVVIGTGRIGAIIGPVLGGTLLQEGMEAGHVLTLIGAGGLLAALILAQLRLSEHVAAEPGASPKVL